MENRTGAVLVMLVLALLLAGCAEQTAAPTAAPAEMPAIVPTEAEWVDENTVPAEIPTALATEESAVPETAVPEKIVSEVPYLLEIQREDQPVYNGPGYDYGRTGTVRQRGIYTIVEETEDFEGNLWGKLKSGIGWVDVTQIQTGSYPSERISANYADGDPVLQGAYHHCASDAEYAIPVVFRAYSVLRDVTLFNMEFNVDGYFPGADFFTLREMTPDMPLVAELAFPGDMSMYGIRFVDETGKTHMYSIYISGRNGEIMLTAE